MTLTVRPIAPSEIGLFTSFADASPLGLRPTPQAYVDGLRRWYRPDWSWVALRHGVVVARVAFSGPLDAPRPYALGSMEIGTGPDRIAIGRELVGMAFAAHGRTRWNQFVPVDWAAHPAMRAAVADRCAVAESLGLRFLVERLELRWSGGRLPKRPGRLEFRPVGSRAEVLPVVAGTVRGTLDATMRAEIAKVGEVAAVHGFVAQLPEPVSLWRLAYAGGQCVGITVPGLGPGGPDVGYVGVLPAFRGRRYADDLVVEASRLLVAAGVTGIDSMTDVGNGPMAASFARCGYAVVDRMLVHA